MKPGFSPLDPAAAPRVWQVGALTRAVAHALEARFNPVAVRGEVSGFARAASGHCYFALKDATGQLRCAMFRRAASLLDFVPAEGDQVELRGRLSVYEPRGELQLVVESMARAGQGALFEQFLRLKARLEAEGLFDAERKRALPALPRGIGVVTSLGAAAWRDVLHALARRVPHIPVLLAPAAVQGAGAPAELQGALRQLYRRAEPDAAQPIDLILLVRGGGSIEDLWAFNDETLARTIAASPVPVISGVGHETDFTIADFVADVRAPTPSAAAELLTPDRDTLLRSLAASRTRLAQLLSRELAARRQRLEWLTRRLRHPGARLREQAQRLDDLELRLRAGMRHRLQIAESRLAHARTGLAAHSPARRLEEQRRVIAQLDKRLATTMRQTLAAREKRLAALAHLLDSVSPLSTLARGYAILSDAEGRVLRAATDTTPGARVQARLASGSIDCTVYAVHP